MVIQRLWARLLSFSPPNVVYAPLMGVFSIVHDERRVLRGSPESEPFFFFSVLGGKWNPCR